MWSTCGHECGQKCGHFRAGVVILCERFMKRERALGCVFGPHLPGEKCGQLVVIHVVRHVVISARVRSVCERGSFNGRERLDVYLARTCRGRELLMQGWTLQGYLAHKKTPPPRIAVGLGIVPL